MTRNINSVEGQQLMSKNASNQYINIGAVDKKCWKKGLIFIWILGQVDEWEGERAYINNRPICKDCECLADRLLWVNLFA